MPDKSKRRSKQVDLSNKKQSTPSERLRAIALWQWGLLLIVAGLLSNQVTSIIMPITGTSAEARSQALGRGLGSLVFVIAGLVLIIVHFVKRRR